MEELRFPIGRFTLPDTVSESEISSFKKTIASFPSEIRALTIDLDNTALQRMYRPEGWNIRQLVHHCADSHMNALIRFKLTLTEDRPTIKPYAEGLWAELADTADHAIHDSLAIIKAVHSRWSVLLGSMEAKEYELNYMHPEYSQEFRLDQALANYDWHCRHHLAHINLALANI